MAPLVSILIPAYNAEAWIAATIKSALDQTWSRKEIIVVDDGSSDQTLTVARQFAAKDVSVVTQENQGAAAARNKAFSLAQGEYIQWLDADDLLARDKIGRQMQTLNDCQNKRTLCSASWGAFYYRTEKARFRPSPLWADLSPVEWLLRKMGQNCHMQTATWLVSRELTEAAGPWDTRLTHGRRRRVFLPCPEGERWSQVRARSQSLLSQRRYEQLELRHSIGQKAGIPILVYAVAYPVPAVAGGKRAKPGGLCQVSAEITCWTSVPSDPTSLSRWNSWLIHSEGASKLHEPVGNITGFKKAFGWRTAKHALILWPNLRNAIFREFDKMMYAVSRPEGGSLSGEAL